MATAKTPKPKPTSVWLRAKKGVYRGDCTPKGKRCPIMRVALEHADGRQGIDTTFLLGGSHVALCVVYRVRVTRTRAHPIALNFCPWCRGALVGE